MKIVKKILLLLGLAYLAVIPVWLSYATSQMRCEGINIVISDSSDYNLVTKRDILNLISGNTRISGEVLKDIPVTVIEKTITGLPELKTAEVYTTVDGRLNIYADQRNPLFRLMTGGGDYFIDDEGFVIRRRKLYTPRLHIVSGNIRVTRQMLDGVSVLDTLVKNSILKDVITLVTYIRSDRFWSAQIDQIYVDDNDEIDLIPRLGNNLIHLGSIENLEGKLYNLEAFYKEVLPEVGWNYYSMINLEYRDQIVCKKR